MVKKFGFMCLLFKFKCTLFLEAGVTKFLLLKNNVFTSSSKSGWNKWRAQDNMRPISCKSWCHLDDTQQLIIMGSNRSKLPILLTFFTPSLRKPINGITRHFQGGLAEPPCHLDSCFSQHRTDSFWNEPNVPILFCKPLSSKLLLHLVSVLQVFLSLV